MPQHGLFLYYGASARDTFPPNHLDSSTVGLVYEVIYEALVFMYKYYLYYMLGMNSALADMMTLVAYSKSILKDIDIKEVIVQPKLETQGILSASPAQRRR
jgi:hypothetical protein